MLIVPVLALYRAGCEQMAVAIAEPQTGCRMHHLPEVTQSNRVYMYVNEWLLLLQNPELAIARTNFQKLEAEVHAELAMQAQRARDVQASLYLTQAW